MRYAKSKRQPERPPSPLAPDQDQRGWQEVGEDNLGPGLVRFGGEKIYLLPMEGSDTQWYQNVLQNPRIRIDARGVGGEFRAISITDATTVKSVVEKFREKYGAKDVKKYHSKFDVAVVTEMG